MRSLVRSASVLLVVFALVACGRSGGPGSPEGEAAPLVLQVCVANVVTTAADGLVCETVSVSQP